MKNKLLNFIDLLIFFFNQGYSLQETLDFCSLLNYEKEVKEIKNYLNQGFSLDEIFIMLPFPTLFKEYYSFFKNEFTLETALKKSIEICKKRDEYKNTFFIKLSYPIILLIFLFVFSIFTVFYLLPQVEILFNDFDIKKSFIIQCLFVLLHAIPVFLTLITIINIILMIFIYQSIAKQKFNQIDFLINHTHFIKKLICKYYSLKFAIYYNELLIQHYDTTSIIETLYDKITDSDIKMIVYELYRLIINGHDFNLAVNDFPYFSDDFKKFISIIQNSHENQSLENYIQLTFMQLNQFVSKFIKIIVPLIYGFVATFVIVVYVSIIIPMMNVVSNL